METKKIIIVGAAGRDFHNFNMYFRNHPEYNVIAFTAAQIPNIDGRKYPSALAGILYPEGISIYPESKLTSLINQYAIDFCVFSYSDVSYQKVMGISAIVHAAGADFMLLGPYHTMLKSTKPVIAVGAIRTGCGKSQTSRKIIDILTNKGLNVIAVRHPMPYGDLVKQKVQRFETIDDLDINHCTIEEMEEYEPYVSRRNIIYAGVDYEQILRSAENDPKGCDIILWDGGNNDFPFFKPDLMVTVTDPHRAGHELTYYPGEVTLRIADVIIINKIDTSDMDQIEILRTNIQKVNPTAQVIDGASPIIVEKPELIRGCRVLVIEDGPTLTHGEMKIGAGMVAAKKFGALECIDPRPFLSGKLTDTFITYPNIGTLLPAMGYGSQQLHDLETTINQTPCDSVIIATPIDLNRIIKINKPTTRVFYDLQEIGKPDLNEVLNKFLADFNLRK